MNRRSFLDRIISATVLVGTTGVTGMLAWPRVLGPIYADITQQAHPEILADCSKDPFDVRPLVQKIMQSANFILDRIPQDTPLVIVMGETHNRPSHIVARMALLKELKEQFRANANKPFAYGIEGVLHKKDREFFKDSPVSPEELYLSFLSSDFLVTSDAPYTSQAAAIFLTEQEIDVQLNDIDSMPDEEILGSVIDQSVPEALELIRKYAPEYEGQKIIRASNFHSENLGLMLSNRMMVQKAQPHIEESKARIYVQHCGTAHALGARTVADITSPDLPYNESLTHYFRKAGFAVMTVLPGDDLNTPHEAVVAMPNTILATGLSQTAANDTDERALLEKLQTQSQFRLTA